MTTIDAPISVANPSSPSVDRVRTIVRADAALCATSGLALVAGAGPLADLAGLDPSWPVAAAGAFLLVLAAALVLLARMGERTLLALTPWSAEGDLLWALGSVGVAILVSLTGPGRALIAGQGLAVAAVGLIKLQAVRRAR